MTTPTDLQPAVRWDKPVWLLAALLAALATLGPFSIDTYLPAFEGIAGDLGTSLVHMQQTLSGYLLGFAVMMLLHGALSDSFGRRPVVLCGLAMFALASALAASATDVGVLIGARVLQGMSCGAGIVVGRAIVRDLFAAAEAQRLMSQITLFFGVAPAIAPIVGGWLLTLLGWRSIFWFLTLVAAVLFVLAARALPETLPPPQRHPFRPGSLFKGYLEVIADRHFLLLTIASGVPFNAMFVFVLSAPMLMGRYLGFPPTQFFWLFLCSIGGIMAGAWASGRLAGRLARETQIRIGFVLLLVVATANALWHHWMPATPWSVLPPIALITCGWALLTPCVTLLVLDRFPRRLGMASSLQAFFTALVNAFVAGVVAPIAMTSVANLAAASASMGLIGFASWRLYRRDRRERRTPLPKAGS